MRETCACATCPTSPTGSRQRAGASGSMRRLQRALPSRCSQRLVTTGSDQDQIADLLDLLHQAAACVGLDTPEPLSQLGQKRQGYEA